MSGFSRKQISTFEEARKKLEADGLTAESILLLSGDLHDAFGEMPSLPMFVLKSLFGELSRWTDSDDIPNRFGGRFLSTTIEWLQSPEAFRSPEMMERVVRAFRYSHPDMT